MNTMLKKLAAEVDGGEKKEDAQDTCVEGRTEGGGEDEKEGTRRARGRGG